MEKRKNSLSLLKACRFCLTKDYTLSSLYDRTMTPKNSLTLPMQIMSCISVEVFPSDRMPSQICDRCRYFMDLCYRFKQICRQADESIMDFVQNGQELEPVVWHSKLAKAYRSANQPQVKRQEKKVAGKANSTEDYETDEDNENIYNIKIGDGPDDGNNGSTCIKVVKTGDKLHITKDDPKGKKEFSSGRKQSSPPERPYQCTYCNKSFVKSHHCTRHVRVKHKDNLLMSPSGPFGEVNQFGCEQCDATFSSQDELIYHSAKHAAENLTCPLCHEKFHHVEEVSAHIKTHVDGAEYMCDLCELVFTSKEKLDNHLFEKHEDELNKEQDLGLEDESMDMDDEEDDDSINVKDAGDHMLVEIKKPSEFIKSPDTELQIFNEDRTHSQITESEAEATYTELATVDTLALAKLATATPKPGPASKIATPKGQDRHADKPEQLADSTAILRKVEEVKRKSSQKPVEVANNVVKAKSTSAVSSSAGASDKSLRLLVKELQELKRTNNPTETPKPPAKSVEMRSRRPMLHTSTPKPKVEEKKSASKQTPVLEKKQPERRVVTKENKEPKEKEPKVNSTKDDKDKESKEPKEVAKNIVKNGAAADRQSTEENVRRSSRPSKVKDYAKMVRDRAVSDDSDDSDEDEEYKEEVPEKVPEKTTRGRKAKPKPVVQAPVVADTPSPTMRKRGRPRKNALKDMPQPAKLKKTNEAEEAADVEKPADAEEPKIKQENVSANSVTEEQSVNRNDLSPTKSPEKANLVVSPTGQTLKKVPIKALPPGVKPMPLPVNAVRNVGSGLCEMQIGKKVVKVQKIVMTKAEVEAMKTQGLLEMKDGTMVLKQGIKLPKSDAASIKSSLVGNETTTESPTKAAPTRCTLEEDS